MEWGLDLGADKCGKVMTVATRRVDEVILKAVTRSWFDLDTALKSRYDVGGLPIARIL